jgi:hypothetical protein
MLTLTLNNKATGSLTVQATDKHADQLTIAIIAILVVSAFYLLFIAQ